MRPLLLLITAISLLVGGCGDDGPTTPDQPQDVSVADATIGASGGTLESEGFQLVVPAGAFDEDHEMTLYLSTSDHPFAEEILTKFYAVEGLPLFNLEPLRVILQTERAPTDSATLIVGYDSLDPTTGNTEYTYDYHSAEDSLGHLVCQIPASGAEVGKQSLRSGGAAKELEDKVHIAAVDKTHKVILTPRFGAAVENDGPVELLGEVCANLELIFDEFNRVLGYAEEYILEDKVKYMPDWFDVRLSKTGSVTDIARPDRFCYYTQEAGWIPGWVYEYHAKDFDIHLYQSKLTGENMSLIRRDLGHYLYYLYPLLFYAQDYQKTEQYWLHHAIASWSEGLFPPVSNFVPLNFTSHIAAPFNGMHIAGELSPNQVQSHGIGMSALIKHLVNTEGEVVIQRIFVALDDHKIALEALQEGTLQEENVWWPGFFKEYIRGNIYNVGSDTFLQKASETWNVRSASDTLKHFDKRYKDLSAKLFRIDLNYSNLRERGTVEFKIGPQSLNLDYVKAMVFGLKDGKLEYLDEGVDFAVGGLQGYTSLLVAVINSASEEPYTGDLAIELDVRPKVSDWPWRYMYLILRNVEADVQSYTPAYDRYDTTKAWSLTFSQQAYEMEKHGSRFTGRKDQIYDWGTHTTQEKGRVTVTVNETTRDVLTFSMIDTTIAESGEDTDIWEVECSQIAHTWHDEHILQQHLTSNVGAHLSKAMWTSVRNKDTPHEIHYKLLSIVSLDHASIEIYWADTEPKRLE